MFANAAASQEVDAESSAGLFAQIGTYEQWQMADEHTDHRARRRQPARIQQLFRKHTRQHQQKCYQITGLILTAARSSDPSTVLERGCGVLQRSSQLFL